jgi:hypothetical protein
LIIYFGDTASTERSGLYPSLPGAEYPVFFAKIQTWTGLAMRWQPIENKGKISRPGLTNLLLIFTGINAG